MDRRTKRQVETTADLRAKIRKAGLSYGDIAHELKYAVTKSDVGHFIYGRFKHLSKANRRRLHRYFIRKKFIAPRKTSGVRITAEHWRRLKRAILIGSIVEWNRVFREIRNSRAMSIKHSTRKS